MKMKRHPRGNHPACLRGAGLSRLVWFGLICCLAFWPTPARADEPLRWKFAVGQKYRVELTQNSSTLTEYETKSSNLSSETRLELSWEVVAVEGAVATVNQRLERLSLQLDLPTTDGAGKVLFDSADPSLALNVKPELKASLQGLVGTSLQVKLRDNGAVEAVEAAPESLAAWQAAPLSAAFREQLSPEGLVKLFAESSFPLPPDEASAAAGWAVTGKLAGPWGELKSETNYRLAGEQAFESRPAQLVRMERKIEPVNAQPAAVVAPAVAEASRLRQHEARGEWYFDPSEGQLLGGKVNQRIEAERSYREEKMKTIYRASTSLRMQRLN